MSIDFDKLIVSLEARLKLPLPGPSAHEPLRAEPMGAVRPKFEHSLPPKPGAVLILLYPGNGLIQFPLTKRPDYLGTHGGQVSLPGGKAEGQETSVETALREGEEEIGIHSQEVTVIGKLSQFFVIPSNFMVTPVVAYCREKPQLVPDPKEVVRILEGSLEDLLKDNAIQKKEILVAKIFRMMASHFLIENEVVWGATAMMLNEFRTILREVT